MPRERKDWLGLTFKKNHESNLLHKAKEIKKIYMFQLIFYLR